VKATVFYGYMKTLLDLIRLRNAVIAFAGVTMGAVVFSLGSPSITVEVLAAAFSASLILSGGNALNDYFDYEIDRVNKPKRPIPSGRVTRSDALMISLMMFLVGLGFAKSINPVCFMIAFVNIIVLILYARYSKRLLFVSNLGISYLVASIFLYGAAATYSPRLWVNPKGVELTVVLSACAFFLTLSRELVKDIEDIEGDMKAYSVTVPIRYGKDNTKKIAFLSALMVILLSFAPIIIMPVNFNELLYGLVILATDAVIVFSFTTNPAVNQRLLLFSMTLALLAFLLGLSAQYLQPG
jgi:geranylgeranylglycerol-phosphate geranylgeranyltransferase